MAIDWNQFTPAASLVGGLLIGGAAALYALGAGRIAGIAGIVGGALQSLRGHAAGAAVSWAFIGGLLVAPWAWRLAAPLPTATVAAGPALLVAAGLLVGFGVRLGQGCTSGHGVCGLSRFSLRSLVNVLAFMGAGIATVSVLRHVA
jgi:uncharacterized membrane protein YedE/YeeE